MTGACGEGEEWAGSYKLALLMFSLKRGEGEDDGELRNGLEKQTRRCEGWRLIYFTL